MGKFIRKEFLVSDFTEAPAEFKSIQTHPRFYLGLCRSQTIAESRGIMKIWWSLSRGDKFCQRSWHLAAWPFFGARMLPAPDAALGAGVFAARKPPPRRLCLSKA
jgi:hypothetical protein